MYFKFFRWVGNSLFCGTNKTEEKIERNKNREGVVTISFTDRATAFDKYGIYHKDIVKGEEEIRGGLKTEMSCVYLRDPKNGETESKRIYITIGPTFSTSF